MTGNLLVIEIDQGTGQSLAADLRDAGVPCQVVAVRSSTGVDVLQLAIQIGAPLIVSVSTVISGYIARGRTIIVVRDGKREEVTDDAEISKILSEQLRA